MRLVPNHAYYFSISCCTSSLTSTFNLKHRSMSDGKRKRDAEAEKEGKKSRKSN